MMTTRTLETPDVDLVHDVHGEIPTVDRRPVLLAIGQPMDATGFRALAAELPDRAVVAYDPPGIGRSVRHDGRDENDPEVQAADLHRLIQALGEGPVEIFGSSGGAVTGLALVTAHPDDVLTLVAHEPPVRAALPDAETADRAWVRVREAYETRGWGAGMAAFMGLIMWEGEFTDAFFAAPPADPAMFGMPDGDDGSRDDVLLSARSEAVGAYRVDLDAVRAASSRVVLGVGEESRRMLPGRAAVGLAALLGQEAVEFPSHHGGFAGAEGGYPGKPEAFARRLEEVLAG
jgi:pimeloyl-ACP methyl ester carboxylesterase